MFHGLDSLFSIGVGPVSVRHNRPYLSRCTFYTASVVHLIMRQSFVSTTFFPMVKITLHSIIRTNFLNN